MKKYLQNRQSVRSLRSRDARTVSRLLLALGFHVSRMSVCVGFLTLTGCSFLNVLDDGHGLCRSFNSDYPESLYAVLEDEKAEKSPNGYLTQPYSRVNWDSYWNSRVFYMWDIGPESCGGTYEGLSGAQIIRMMLARREDMQLPKIIWDERNAGKSLNP